MSIDTRGSGFRPIGVTGRVDAARVIAPRPSCRRPIAHPNLRALCRSAGLWRMHAALQKVTLGIRVAGIGGIVSLALAACSSNSVNVPIAPNVAPSPPTQATVISVAKIAATENKLAPPLEISAVRPTDHGPGRYFVCMREARPASERRMVYSVFFDNEVYKGSRQSVIIEACETQAFNPIEVTPPAPSPQPGRNRKR
jgi:hypothetical protein